MRKAAAVLITLCVMACQSAAGPLGQVWASASVRNPRQDVRVVGADTLSNPFDYELAAGVEDNTGPLRGYTTLIFERQDGVHYVGHEHELVLRAFGTEWGWNLTDREDSDLFAHRFWAAKTMFRGVVGIGVARQWFDRWTGDGAWMARFSVGYDSVDVLRIAMSVRAELEQSKEKQRASFRLEVRDLAFGPDDRFSIVPVIRMERVDDGKRVRGSYQAKVMLRMEV